MVDIIAEEKGLPKDTVLSVIEQAIAAAWRKDNGDRDMNVRAVLNTKTGEADVYVAREVIEEGVAYNPSTEIPLDKAEKGAKLGYSLVSNHAFLDGNKRIGIMVMLSFLEINGIHLSYTDNELIDLGLGLASDKISYKDLLTWVKTHKKQ